MGEEEVPRAIGPYELGREIGRGSCGVVYEGFDTDRGIRAAVKDYSRISERARAGVPRLHRDAQAAGALGHPNIATVIGVGEQGGRPWVATELVTGVNLAQVARSRAAWPIERVLDIWRQLCEGLAHAHREGLLHLDLKPSDVRFTSDGDVKVLDFGSWHLKSLERQGAAGHRDDGLHYRPPEVLAGRRPDRRADIFAVAAMIFELVARRRAFPGESTTDVIRSLSRCEPDLAALASSAFSPGFEQILAVSLARDPRERPAAFEEVHADLVQLVRETAPRLRESAASASPGARTGRDLLLAELTRARAEDRLEDALDVCRSLLALDPADETARRALPEVESVLTSREAEALVGEALTLAADGDIEAATRLAEKVERLAPWSPRYLQLQVYLDEEGARHRAADLMKAARAHLTAGRSEQARAVAEEALGILPGFEAAVQLLERVGRLESPSPEASEPASGLTPSPEATLPDHEATGSGAVAAAEPAATTGPAPATGEAPAGPTPPGPGRGEVYVPAAFGLDPGPEASLVDREADGSEAATAVVAEAVPTPEGARAASGPAAEEARGAEEADDASDPDVAVREGAGSSPIAPTPPTAPLSPPASPARKSQAEELTADALRAFVANEYGRAREAVERALDLDPVNRRAQELQRILRVLG